MRTIKFRAWDNHYKYMNYKVLVGIYGEWEEVKDDENYTSCAMWIEPENVDYKCEPHWTHFEPYHKDIHLMQYTGLKDKNGKEIYEGDLVKHIYDIKPYIVHFKEDRGGYSPFANDGGCGCCCDIDSACVEGIEVIGNIYENKDLLEKEGK